MSSRPTAEAAVRSAMSRAPPIEFQRQWRTGQQPQIESFVSEWPAMSVSELAAVARIDLRQRWRRGEQPAAGDYLARFPELLAEPGMIVDLIYSEFLVREELGQRPHLAELQRQYPQHADELAAQIELHRALEASEEQPGVTAETQQPEQTLGQHQEPSTRLPSLGPGYEILAEIGHGGMGVVYRARQIGLNRQVALKMVRGAEYASSEVLARFRAEAEVVARLHHPNIVQIYDYGEHGGLPYLALELVEGGTLATQLDGTPWPARKAAGLIQTLALAVEFAHHRGVIHRDLKPANVLLCTDGNGVKIADFGLAKAFREHSSGQTQSGELLGTPSYMAPEQAAGRVQQIGPAADVYALGAILYELLTGGPPFRGESPIDTLQQLLTSEPVSISLIAPRLPRDLATICSKCLCREPARRYSSAAELADDLARFLADQPIRARPTSRAEHAWRWCRRNPALAGALGAVAVLLLCVATISTWYSTQLGAQLNKTQQAEKAERESNQTARLRLWDAYLAEITARNTSHRVGQRFRALETVDRATALLDEIGRTPERTLQLRNATIASLALPDMRRVRAWPRGPSADGPFDFSLAADRFVVCSRTGEVKVCRLSDQRELLALRNLGPFDFLNISPDGQYLTVRGADRLAAYRVDGQESELLWQQPLAERFAFVPGGREGALSDARGMRLVELATGQTIRPLGRGRARSDFAFHPASGRVAVCGPDSIQIISCETGEVLSELNPKSVGDAPIAWHPSGNYLADFTVGDLTIALWDVRTGQRAMTFENAGASAPLHLDFGGGGSHLLSYTWWDGNLKLWDAATGAKLLDVPGFPMYACDVSSAGQLTLFACTPDQTELWEIALAEECRTLATGIHTFRRAWKNARVDSDDRLLVVGLEYGFELWDLRSRQSLAVWRDGTWCLPYFDQSGQLLTFHSSGLYCWPRHEQFAPSSGSPGGSLPRRTIRFGPPQKLIGPLVPASGFTDPTGEVFLFIQQNQWNVVKRGDIDHRIRLAAHPEARNPAISADRRYVALANWGTPETAIFEVVTGRKLTDLATGRNGNPLFSPDSRWLATTPNGVHVWSVGNWQPVCEMRAQGSGTTGLNIAFSPDSRVLAIGQTDAPLRLADPATGADYAELAHPDLKRARVVAFSPDQTKLVTMPLVNESPAFIWDLAKIRQELTRRGLDWPADVLRPLPRSAAHDESAMLAVTLDDGGLLVRQQALEILRQAANASPAQKLERYRRALDVDPTCAAAHNNLAWLLVAGPESLRDAPAAVTQARRAVQFDGNRATYWNTLGVALYRDSQYSEAIDALKQALDRGGDSAAGYDLVFLALCHSRLGNETLAGDYYVRAETWLQQHHSRLSPLWQEELSSFFAEAKAVGLPRQAPAK